MYKALKTYTLIILLVGFSLPAMASTLVTDNITQNTTWDKSGSPYLLNSRVQVYENITLRILPGVEVLFDGSAVIEIGGQLVARGTEENPILFRSNNFSKGVVFLQTAPSAAYKTGERPSFIYDNTNNQIKLGYDDSKAYDSGSIIEFCRFENFENAIAAYDSLPLIMNSTIKGCELGVYVDFGPVLPIYRWFYFYNNLVEGCGIGLKMGQYWKVKAQFKRGIALIAGNTFKDCGQARMETYCSIVDINGYRSAFLLFNNQIINNQGIGVGNNRCRYNIWPNDSGVGPLILMGNNAITHNCAGVSLNGWTAILQNYIVENHCDITWEEYMLGAGMLLTGPAGLVFNNTIQQNGVSMADEGFESHGDGVALASSPEITFILNHNNLGNAEWDMQDIYIVADENNCSASKQMSVDARWNNWMAQDPSAHIHDYENDMCAGTVDYLPVRESVMIPSPMDSPPVLQSPADNACIPGSTSINFTWDAVTDATKYMLCIIGKDTHYTSYSLNQMKIVQGTSAEIEFSSMMAFNYGMKVILWFVVAGNDDGWSLPSEIRKVSFSPNPFMVEGKIIDENEAPVAEAYVGHALPDILRDPAVPDPLVFSISDKNGDYALIPELEHDQIHTNIYHLKKRGYVDCYTFPRGQREFDAARDLMILSLEQREALYENIGISSDPGKGDIAGIVINEKDEALTGIEIRINPASATVLYLNDGESSDQKLTKTGRSGSFMIPQLSPGEYQLSAHAGDETFNKTVSVYKDAITIDALLAESASQNNEEQNNQDDEESEDGGGGGGGGGCFIKITLSPDIPGWGH